MLAPERLAEIRSKGIDLSDIPEWTEADFGRARFRHPEAARAELERQNASVKSAEAEPGMAVAM